MKISQTQLQKIIIEEYAKEEGIDISEDKADDLLDYIRGGPKPDWMDDSRKVPDAPKVPDRPARADDTMPFPSDDVSLVDKISALVKGMDPEEVSDLFQAVFAKIPGVEMGPAEEKPETLYSPGAEGRPQVGFREELVNKAYARILEMAGIGDTARSYGTHSMAGVPGNRHVDDDNNYEHMSDLELIDMAERDGIEEIIITDGDGDLVNREEVIAALKDV